MTAVLKQEPKDLGSLFVTFTEDEIDLIKATVCKNSTDNELKLFLYTARNAGLDPLLKQIYAVKRGGSMTIQTGIDGFRTIAQRTGMYSPGDETKYSYKEDKSLLSATAYVKKMTRDGTWHQISSTAFFEEYAQSYNGRLSQFWGKMPHVMLSKVAESNALRKAFPFELGALYSSEEMHNGISKTKVEDEFLTEETIGTAPQDDVAIEIPEGADLKLVDEYIKYLEKLYSQTNPVIKSWINKSPKRFWETFPKWVALQEKKTKEEEEEKIVEIKEVKVEE